MIYGWTAATGAGWTGYSSLVSDAYGNVYALNDSNGGVYVYATGTNSWVQVGSGDSMLASDASGNVFALNASTGIAYEHEVVYGWYWWSNPQIRKYRERS
jgi:hypothetical protein